MPITINPQNPVGLVGPGLSIRLQTDFIGPLPSTNVWSMNIGLPGDESGGYTSQVNSNSNPIFITPLIGTKKQESRADNVFGEGTAVSIVAVIQPAGGGPEEDQGQADSHWSNTAGIANQLKQINTGAGTGLTPVEAQQLAETHDSTFPEFLVDQLTLQALASVPTGDPVNAFLTSPVFGVIVRIASVPAELVATTPDGDYWFSSLAIVRIFRGSDLWLRVPIHTSSKLINLWMEGLAMGLADVVLNAGWLLNLSIQVTFREGVTGTVFLMRVP